MNTTRFMIMAVALCIGLGNAAPPPITPVAESITEVLLAQAFDSAVAGIEPMGWFAIRSGDGQCTVTRNYAASIAQSFRIGCSPIWDGLYGYGFATPPGGVVRVETKILCDTIGAAKPYWGVKIGRFFYEMVGDPERRATRWSNGDGRWSLGPALRQGVWNTVRMDVDVTRGVARYWLNGRVVLDNNIGAPAPEFARSTEAIYLGVIAGAAGVAYFDDITICQMSQQSLPMIQPAQRVAPMRPQACPMAMQPQDGPRQIRVQGGPMPMRPQACPMAMQPPMPGRPPMQVQKEIYVVTTDGKGTMPCVKCKEHWAKSEKPCGKGKKPCDMKPCDKDKKLCGGPCMQGKPCGKKCQRMQKKMKKDKDAKGPCPQA
ncbi:MAG: hypothetical protein NTV22_04590 [bacterium]|nr:hypothetical protein [bacterium]